MNGQVPAQTGASVSGQLPAAMVTDDANLNDDLYKALSEKLEFSGNFYHCSTDPNAPNPGLTIDGIGLIGLPLSERDAKTIIARAAQAPFGKGNKTVVDKKVRDTWEIEPAHVSFNNPQWKTFVEKLGSNIVPTTLGVAPGISRPRCELYKLLLYQPGSHFLPHQDTSKAAGMFATIVIVLPSAFEGGEVHVSHARQKAVLKISENSAYSTSILAWYTDVVHEVKPITSGYRLALSFNLIHTATGAPQPSLPDTSGAAEAIRRVLTKWKDGSYECLPSMGLVAYLLAHEYSLVDFQRGSQSLKGSDAHQFASLAPVAKELGFVVCLANLEVAVSGTAEGGGYGGCGYARHKRARWGYYDNFEDDYGDEGTPDMGDIDSQTNTLSNLVRVTDGKRICAASFNVDDECLVPEGTVTDSEPTRKEYEGYMGNWGGTLEQWYERSVLVLYPEKDETRVMVKINGLPWATQALKDHKGKRTTPRIREIATAVQKDLIKSKEFKFSYLAKAGTVSSAALALMEFAMATKDAALWNVALPYSHSALESATSAISEALAVFKLPSLQAGLDAFVKQTPAIQGRFDIVRAVESRVGGKAISTWADALMTEVVSSYTAADIKDIPSLVWIAQKKGLGSIQTMLVRDILKKGGTFTFLVALVKALHEHRDQFPKEVKSAAKSKTKGAAPLLPAPEVSTVILQCVMAAAQQWEPTSPPQYHYARATDSSAKVDRVCELVDLCYIVGDLGPCTPLLVAVLAGKDKTLYKSLGPKLKATLAKYKTEMTVEPFKSFTKQMVSQYLVDVLGPRAAAPQINPTPIGCGQCSECLQLDAFLKNAVASIQFKLVQARRTHLEGRIHRGNVANLVTYQTVRMGTPHTLIVTKRPEVVAGFAWKAKQDAATAFVKGIGEKDVQAVVGAERWKDVVKAVKGTQAYPAEPWDGVLPVASGVVSGPVAVAAAPSTTAAPSGSESSVPRVAGVKRKKG